MKRQNCGTTYEKAASDEASILSSKKRTGQSSSSKSDKKTKSGGGSLARLMEGKTEEEALSMKLPDYLATGLDVIFVSNCPFSV